MIYRGPMAHIRLRLARLISTRRLLAPLLLGLGLAVALIAGACSRGESAGQVLSGAELKPTATAVILGTLPSPTPTVVVVPTVDPAATAVAAVATLTPEATAPTPTVTVILSDAAFTNSSKVTTVGLDEVFFGMSPDQAAAAASTSWNGVPDGSWPNCFVVTPSNGPDGVSFWIWNRTVERVNISNAGIRTRSGYGVGTKLIELQNALGSQLEITDFDDGLQVAEFTPSDPTDQSRIVFEAQNGEVFRFRSGREGPVGMPDSACS